MNPVSIVGAVLALLGAVFVTLLMTQPSFVEIFIALEDFSEGDDGEKTDVVGFVGVYDSGYDAAKITPEEAENITVLPGKYDTETTEFPLLFPAQTNFLDDIYPLTAEALAAIPGTTPQDAVVLGIALEAALPEFSDCDTYFDEVQAGQDTLLQALTPELEAVFDGLWTTPGEAFPALYDAAGSPFYAHTLIVQAFLAPQLDSCGLANVGGNYAYTNYATQQSCVATALGTVAAGLAAAAGTDPSLLPIAGYFSAVSGIVAGTATCSVPDASFLGCTYQNLQLVPTEKLTDDWTSGIVPIVTAGSSDTPCIFQGAATCTVGSAVGQITAVVQYMLTADQTLAAVETNTDILGALGSVTQLFLTFMIPGTAYPEITQAYAINVTDPSDYQSVHNVLVKVVPESFLDDIPTCDLYVALGQISAPAAGTCNFLYLLDEAIDLLLANLDPGFGPLVEQIIGLYKTCVQITDDVVVAQFTSPNQCPRFWPSLFVHASYLNSLEPSAYFLEGPNAVYDQAKAKCKDDEKDIAAIEKAQVLSPLGAGLAAVGCLLGVVGGITEKKGANLVAGVLSLVGGLMVLGALLSVRNAPIYNSVGGDAEAGVPLYLPGMAQMFGIIGMGLAALGGIVLIISAFFNPIAEKSVTTLEEKAASI